MTRPAVGAIVLLPLLFIPTAAVGGEPPYPPSPTILEIEWDLEDIQDAHGSDGWTVTWAADGNLYTAFEDGWGFDYPPDCPDESQKLSTGWAALQGRPEDYYACNVDSNDEPVGDGASGKKATGLVSVGGVLYAAMSNADLSGRECELWSSDDFGLNWTDAGWNFTQLGFCAFLNFGPDYAGARDGFVYLYSPDTRSAYTEADQVVLARAPTDQVLVESAWEYYAGATNGEPVWSAEVADRAGVFLFDGGCNRLDVVHFPTLRRYLMTMRSRAKGDSSNPNHFSIYDAPEPWGPWTTVYYTESALPDSDMSPINQGRGAWGEHEHIPAKWISADGTEFWLLYSGDDKFTLRRARMLISPGRTPSCEDAGPFQGAPGSGQDPCKPSLRLAP